MGHLINNLAKENQSYFKGKELRFENNAFYYQCLKHPIQLNSYILVHDVNVSFANNQNLVIPSSNEDMKLFSQNSSKLISYTTAEPKVDSDNKIDDDQSRESTLISFWIEDQNGQL